MTRVGRSHGFILDDRQYRTIDYPGAVDATLGDVSPSGESVGFRCTGTYTRNYSFILSKHGIFTSFDPPGASSSTASSVNPSGAIVGSFTAPLEWVMATVRRRDLYYD